MKEQFGDRLFRLRKENDMTIEEFAHEMNKKFPNSKPLSKPMVSKYENNIHRPQSFSLVEEIAEFYGVTTDFLMCRTRDKYEKVDKMPSFKRIPILGVIAADIPILAQENVEGHDFIPENMPADFCLRVKGDSMMNARILDGDLVYIHQQPDVENGEIAAVLIDGENATLKRVYKGDGTITLHAENPNHKDLVFAKKDMKQISIIGKAIRFSSEVR